MNFDIFNAFTQYDKFVDEELKFLMNACKAGSNEGVEEYLKYTQFSGQISNGSVIIENLSQRITGL